ncbi:MAG: peroxiredoxin, partial [Gammaproteobacteria bacterium]|nr:peroxiredoxin [Gammaproteobacteria bacterium]NNJ72299.1 peroxiredoxin [Enterobacterales bacterium]
MSQVELGRTITDFSLFATSDKTISRDDLLGQNTVIYFYPKDSTPGCTTEGRDFSAHYSDFQAANTVVYGVSRDSIKSHENFKAKQEFPFELISDPDETLCNIFDVIKLKKLYGREYMGIERSTFLLNEKAQLIKEWRKIKVKGHVEDVLNSV